MKFILMGLEMKLGRRLMTADVTHVVNSSVYSIFMLLQATVEGIFFIRAQITNILLFIVDCFNVLEKVSSA